MNHCTSYTLRAEISPCLDAKEKNSYNIRAMNETDEISSVIPEKNSRASFSPFMKVQNCVKGLKQDYRTIRRMQR